MDSKKYYVITQQIGGDMDIFYLIFKDKTYFDLFLEANELLNDNKRKELFDLIDDCQQVDGLFDWFYDLSINCDGLGNLDFFDKVCESTDSIEILTNIIKDGIIVEETSIITC